ncbi:MAG: hypothetical protein ABFR33_04930 [Verrucomicrobiota bacterium]
MKINTMNKQGQQAETRVPYRALAIGALVWGAIYLAIATGIPWLLVPVIGIYSLMFLAPLEIISEWIQRRMEKRDVSNKVVPHPLYDRHRATHLHLASQTGSQDMQNEKSQAEAKTSHKTAA